MKPSLRLALGLLAATLVITHLPGAAHAQSSLGIGVNDGMAPTTTGPFAHILMWINLRQQEFYHSLRLWHLPRRRPWPRKGGDLLLHGRQ